VLIYARAHTQTTSVIDVSPGVGRTHGKQEESRSTKAQYTCGPYRCTKYTCLYDDDCFYYHSWRNNVVIAFGTLSSFLT